MAETKYVKFRRGTPALFNALTTKNSDTLYFIADASSSKYSLYLGEKAIASEVSLSEITDIAISQVGDKEVLVYNESSGKWVNSSLIELIPNFTGATSTTQGSAGLVPAPGIGEQGFFLRGDGTWAEVSTAPTVAATQVFQTDAYEYETTLEALERKIGENADLNVGDIGIVRVLIADDKYEYTAYVYDGENWAAMDGNYSADNVYFNSDFVFTTKIGTVQSLTNGSTTVAAKGKSVQNFLSGLFAAEANPTTTQPSASVSSGQLGAYEVGSSVALTYTINTSAGSYTYGPSTGVTFSDFEATFNGETLSGKTGTFSAVQVTDDFGSKQITATCHSSEGAIPKTNLGNEYPAGQIGEKDYSLTSATSLTGYRAWFYGYKNGENALTIADLNSDDIRGLSSAKGTWTKQMSVSQMKQMFFAAPAGKGSKPSVQDHSTTAPQTIKGPVTVSVEGANGYDAIDYDVWYVDNADAASGSAVLDITW